MTYKSDIEIAQSVEPRDIRQIAEVCGVDEHELELYGYNKAKISLDIFKRLEAKPDGKLILVTAINPTPAGEGKSTVTIGLAQALNKIGKQAIVAMREPSLGPVMGVKGGAAGGGFAQVIPMEDLNLHFTGDMHAITTAHNSVSAFIDNHIFQGNELGIDHVTWKRVVDLNDRALRQAVVALSDHNGRHARNDGFDITVASEIMAIICLARDMTDLKARLGRIIVGFDYQQQPVTVADLGIVGALAVILKDALKPNLIQTLEHTPALVHGGPFANIAHGCNSVIATRLGMKLADYTVTEAGFGADLGAEKFFDIKCRAAGLQPDAVVVVATIRALKMHGGVEKAELGAENVEALLAGIPNLEKHVENMQAFGVPYVIAINKFVADTDAEVAALLEWAKAKGHPIALTEVWEHGGAGGVELAEQVVELIATTPSEFAPIYDAEAPIVAKLEAIAKTVYGADGVRLTKAVERQIAEYERLGFDRLPICMAKTQYSLSDNAKLLGRPQGFEIHIRELRISNGAGFIVALTGAVMTMPGLPKHPAMLDIDIDEDGVIKGLF